MTPFEIDLVTQSRHEQRREDIVTSAWMTAMYERQKRLPSLQSAISPPRTVTLSADEAIEKERDHQRLLNSLKAAEDKYG